MSSPARTPEHKLRMIVTIAGERADSGIAMEQRGSEAAKEAADLVPTDDNFTSIAAAVREGLSGPSRYARTSRVREWQTTRYRSR